MIGPLPLRIVGCGSPHGDDVIGWEVVRQLERLLGRQPGLTFHTIAGGEQLLDLLDGQGTLLLIDALAPAGTPGAIRYFPWPDPSIEALRPGSTHQLRPAPALQLAAVLELLPPCVVVASVEIADLTQRDGLSPAVAAVVPEFLKQLMTRLQQAFPNQTPTLLEEPSR